MKPSTYLQLLSLIFIACKLAGTIDWSWWLVLAPLWGWHASAFVVGIVVGMYKAAQWDKARRAMTQKGKGTPEV